MKICGDEILKNSANQLVVANHPTLIDVVILISLMKNVDCIVKEALWQNPLLRRVVIAAGYIRNSNSAALIEEASDALRSGRSLIVFPEGTRSQPGSLHSFQRGAARIALKSRRSITPVVITCNPPSLTKGQRWYHIPRYSRVFMTVKVGEPFSVDAFVNDEQPTPKAARKLTQYLQSYFDKELQKNG